MSSCKTSCCSEAVISKVIEKYSCDKCNLIPILHDIQREIGYVSPEAMENVADALGITTSQVHGVTTFYSMFYTKEQGKNVIRLCDSPPCHIEGSKTVREAITKELGVCAGETTKDGNFTLEVVSCMGLCGVAPAIMVNDDVYGNLTPEVIPSILNKYKEAK